MVVASLVVAVFAAGVAVAALVRDHLTDRRQRGLESTQVEQADAIAELVRIERARAQREAERDAQAARAAAQEEAAEREHQASANLDVLPLFPRPGSGQKVNVMNAGPHKAVLLEAEFWGPERDQPSVRVKPEIPDGGIPIEHMQGVPLEVTGLAAGQAWWRLIWTDGRDGAWAQEGGVVLFERPERPDPFGGFR